MSRRFRFGFCWAVFAAMLVLFTLQAVAPIAAAAEPQPSARALARVMAVQDRNTQRLMALRGVVGTATGVNAAGQPVVNVFVAEAGLRGIPANLEGEPVVVVVTGEIFALGKPPWAGGGKDEEVDRTARFERPVPIGVSTGHPNITAGTIGCRVTDGTDVYVLSNNHVYADENLAGIGDNVLQPGTYDGGSDPADAIATLYDFEAIDFSGGDNTIDAAIALSSTDLVGNATPPDGYGLPKLQTAPATLNLKVKKYGRTTGLTKGFVWAINATVDVGYSSGTARFVNQIVAYGDRLIEGGDSGSLLVVDGKGRNKGEDRKPVGLLFAGNPTGDFAIANPIELVLTRFSVTVDGE